MLEQIKAELNTAFTENGAVTPATTGSDCLDFFASVGGKRNASDDDICTMFIRAFAENPDSAMKILFFARDIRGGLGERRVFRVILRWLALNRPASVRRNIAFIAEFGRFDDLLELMGTPCEADAVAFIRQQLDTDLAELKKGGSVSLLAKWMPSVNASSAVTVRQARRLASALGMTEPEYRRTLVRLRRHLRIIENNLRRRDYTFSYSAQPSKAMLKYRKAFIRNDRERYLEFLSDVSSGKATMNTSAIYPYELVAPLIANLPCFGFGKTLKTISEEEQTALNTAWDALPDFCGDENALAVVDGSGSMYTLASPSPASVAFSLGLYFAERSKGVFRNHFITFSERPRLVEVKGETFVDRLAYISTFDEVANTNIEAVFDLILSTAVKNRAAQEELPSSLYIISDMEFDCCAENADLNNFENAKKRFGEAGYKLPRVVFWNVAARNRHQPVTMNEQGVTLVSGCSPRIFDMMSHDALDPFGFMMSVIGSERYSKISA